MIPANAPMPLEAEKRLLFETIVVGGDNDGRVERYETWAEALAGHERWVDACEAILLGTTGRAITLREEDQ